MVGSAGYYPTRQPAASRSQACRRACPAHDAGRGAPALLRPRFGPANSLSAMRVRGRRAVVKDIGVQLPHDGRRPRISAGRIRYCTPLPFSGGDPQRLVHAPRPHLPPLRRRLSRRRLGGKTPLGRGVCMCKRQRLASAEAASDPRARWIVLDDFQKAISAASTVPWRRSSWESMSTKPAPAPPVRWESVSTRPSVAPDHLWHPDYWQHDVVWVPCAAGAVAIHRFTPQPGAASSVDELSRLSELAAEEMAAGGGGGGDSASNVGGYHGARDLWSRPELHEGALPWLVGSAVQQAAAAESAALQQGLTPTSVDECWFNMLRPGGWNCLHTHAGSTYSAAFFVADGACSDAADPLAGRLAFLPGGPPQAVTADLHARSAPSLQLLCSSPDAPAPHPN